LSHESHQIIPSETIGTHHSILSALDQRQNNYQTGSIASIQRETRSSPNSFLTWTSKKKPRAMEFYVDVTNYHRNYNACYVQPSAPLKATTTALSNQAPGADGNARKAFARDGMLSLDDSSLRQSLGALQAQFKRPHFPWHFDPTRQNYYELDSNAQLQISHNDPTAPTSASLDPLVYIRPE
jgi:hypothetical protein